MSVVVSLQKELSRLENEKRKIDDQISACNVLLKAHGAETEVEKPSTKRVEPRKPNGRANATELVVQFFVDRDNQPAKKSEIVKATGVHAGTVQNLVSKSDAFSSKPVVPGGRNLVWKMDPKEFKKRNKG